jgi:hypothetical protein
MFDLFICYAFHRVVSASQFTAVVFHIKFIGTGPLLHPIKIELVHDPLIGSNSL